MARRRGRPPVIEDLRKYAVIGAEARLLEIAAEAAAIYRVFPELRERGGAGAAANRSEPDVPAPSRRGRHMRKASARRAARERMKRYWAERRKQEREGGKAQPTRAARGGGRRGPRKMSAAARKRISEAQKKRWAARKRAQQ